MKNIFANLSRLDARKRKLAEKKRRKAALINENEMCRTTEPSPNLNIEKDSNERYARIVEKIRRLADEYANNNLGLVGDNKPDGEVMEALSIRALDIVSIQKEIKRLPTAYSIAVILSLPNEVQRHAAIGAVYATALSDLITETCDKFKDTGNRDYLEQAFSLMAMLSPERQNFEVMMFPTDVRNAWRMHRGLPEIPQEVPPEVPYDPER